jgi:hypothetical protein
VKDSLLSTKFKKQRNKKIRRKKMAVLKSIYQKEKTYIFKSFDNDKNENPAKIVFKRFPFPDEVFPLAAQKNVLESSVVKAFDNSNNAKEALVEHIINTMIENITANRINYNLFITECVDYFEELIYEDKEIKTIKDFLNLPELAVYKIAQEAYTYSKKEDTFTIEEKKI